MVSPARRGAGGRGRCSGARACDPLLDALPYDAADRGILTIARWYCRTFAHPASQAWLNATGCALKAFDHGRAPGILVATQSVLQAMRRTRRSILMFDDPACAACARRATGNERAPMSTIRAARMRRPDQAIGHAALLCEGNDPGAFLSAVLVLAGHLPTPSSTRPRPGPVDPGLRRERRATSLVKGRLDDRTDRLRSAPTRQQIGRTSRSRGRPTSHPRSRYRGC